MTTLLLAASSSISNFPRLVRCFSHHHGHTLPLSVLLPPPPPLQCVAARGAGRSCDTRRRPLLRIPLPRHGHAADVGGRKRWLLPSGIGGLPCCLAAVLPAAAGIATMGGRTCYKELAVLLPTTEALAAAGERRRLLPAATGIATKEGRTCYKELAALLPTAEALAAAGELRRLLPAVADIATKGGWTCYKELAAFLPAAEAVAASSERRRLLRPPLLQKEANLATKDSRTCCKRASDVSLKVRRGRRCGEPWTKMVRRRCCRRQQRWYAWQEDVPLTLAEDATSGGGATASSGADGTASGRATASGGSLVGLHPFLLL